jgi:hypothetical protein
MDIQKPLPQRDLGRHDGLSGLLEAERRCSGALCVLITDKGPRIQCGMCGTDVGGHPSLAEFQAALTATYNDWKASQPKPVPAAGGGK